MDLIKSGSSAVDWCESNYKMVSYIAEFFNTLSNALFFIIPPIMICLFKDYGKYVNKGIHVIWFLLIAVGFGSVYFHATLSMVGQLMDEIFILWVLMTGYAVLFPENYLPLYFRKNRKSFFGLFLLITFVITFLCCIRPKLNAYFLMVCSVPVMSLLCSLTKRCRNDLVVDLSRRTFIIWFLSVVCWILDRAFCDFWIRIDMPYMHSLFHVLVFLSSYSSVVLYAYFLAEFKVPHLEPTLTYWPSDYSNRNSYKFLFLPYITFLPKLP